MIRRYIDTYVSKIKSAPEYTRPSLNNGGYINVDKSNGTLKK